MGLYVSIFIYAIFIFSLVVYSVIQFLFNVFVSIFIIDQKPNFFKLNSSNYKTSSIAKFSANNNPYYQPIHSTSVFAQLSDTKYTIVDQKEIENGFPKAYEKLEAFKLIRDDGVLEYIVNQYKPTYHFKSLDRITQLYKLYFGDLINLYDSQSTKVNYYSFGYFIDDYFVTDHDTPEDEARRHKKAYTPYKEYKNEQAVREFFILIYNDTYEDYRSYIDIIKCPRPAVNLNKPVKFFYPEKYIKNWQSNISYFEPKIEFGQIPDSSANTIEYFWCVFSYFFILLRNIFYFEIPLFFYYASNILDIQNFPYYNLNFFVFYFSVYFTITIISFILFVIFIRQLGAKFFTTLSIINIYSFFKFFMYMFIKFTYMFYTYSLNFFSNYISIFEFSRFKRFNLILPDYFNTNSLDVFSQLPYLKSKIHNISPNFSKTTYNSLNSTYPGLESWDVIDYMLNPIELNLYYSNHPVAFNTNPEPGLYRARPSYYDTLKNRINVFFVNEYSFPYLYVEENFTKISSFVNRFVFVLIMCIFFPVFFIVEFIRFSLINFWLYILQAFPIFFYNRGSSFNILKYYKKLIYLCINYLYRFLICCITSFYFFSAIGIVICTPARPFYQKFFKFLGIKFCRFKHLSKIRSEKISRSIISVIYFYSIKLYKFICKILWHCHTALIVASDIFLLEFWKNLLVYTFRFTLIFLIGVLMLIPFEPIKWYVEVRFFFIDISKLLWFEIIGMLYFGVVGFPTDIFKLYGLVTSYTFYFSIFVYGFVSGIIHYIRVTRVNSPKTIFYKFNFDATEIKKSIYYGIFRVIFGPTVFKTNKFNFILNFPLVPAPYVEEFDMLYFMYDLDDYDDEEFDKIENEFFEEDFSDEDLLIEFDILDYVSYMAFVRPGTDTLFLHKQHILRTWLAQNFTFYKKYAEWHIKAFDFGELWDWFFGEFDPEDYGLYLLPYILEHGRRFDYVNFNEYCTNLIAFYRSIDEPNNMYEFKSEFIRAEFYSQNYGDILSDPSVCIYPKAISKINSFKISKDYIISLVGYNSNKSLSRYVNLLSTNVFSPNLYAPDDILSVVDRKFFYDFFFFKWNKPEFVFKYSDQIKYLMPSNVIMDVVESKLIQYYISLSFPNFFPSLSRSLGTYDSLHQKLSLIEPTIKMIIDLDSHLDKLKIAASSPRYYGVKNILSSYVIQSVDSPYPSPSVRFGFYSANFFSMYFSELRFLPNVNLFEIYTFSRNVYSHMLITKKPYYDTILYNYRNLETDLGIILFLDTVEVFYMALHEFPSRNMFALAQTFGMDQYYFNYDLVNKTWDQEFLEWDEMATYDYDSEDNTHADSIEIPGSDMKIEIQDVYINHKGYLWTHPQAWFASWSTDYVPWYAAIILFFKKLSLYMGEEEYEEEGELNHIFASTDWYEWPELVAYVLSGEFLNFNAEMRAKVIKRFYDKYPNGEYIRVGQGLKPERSFKEPKQFGQEPEPELRNPESDLESLILWSYPVLPYDDEDEDDDKSI